MSNAKLLEKIRASRAGCLALKRTRSTHKLVGLYRAAEALLDDDDGPYVTVCEEHGGLVNHRTLTLARQWLAHPEDWCPRCQGDERA